MALLILVYHEYFGGCAVQSVGRYTDGQINSGAYFIPENVFAIPGCDASIRGSITNHIPCQICDFYFGIGYQTGDGDDA